MKPFQITDENDNNSLFTFSPLGLLKSIAVLDRKNKGDDASTPGTTLEYDFDAFINNGDPVWVKTTQRLHHVNEDNVPSGEENETIVKVEYSDGFGRLLQTRTQAEDVIYGDPVLGDSGLPADQAAQNQDATGTERQSTDPLNVVVSGWQVYDNKGRVVEKYEPFFDKGFDYVPPTIDLQDYFAAGYISDPNNYVAPLAVSGQGQKIKMYYDPRGQVIRTINPDNTEQRVIFGIPDDLALTPFFSPPSGGVGGGGFTPTPWESYTYDANDLGGGWTAPADYSGTTDDRSLGHHYTPSSAEIDALGRTIKTIQRLSYTPPPGGAGGDEVVMQYEYDIRGNTTKITDALGRTAFEHKYDLANQTLWTKHIDAGEKTVVYNAVGLPVELRDEKGSLVLNAYGRLLRPFKIWARDNGNEAVTLRQQIVYGELSDLADPRDNNHRGKPYRHYDEAGMTEVTEYDFKGNMITKKRQVISDDEILGVFAGPPANWEVPTYRVEWTPDAGDTLDDRAAEILDATVYQTDAQYDALNRVKEMTLPEDVNTDRKVINPTYNRAGALHKVDLDGTEYVKEIAYNAKGQRLLVAFGNDIMTRYSYDEHNFRLLRMKSERYSYSQAAQSHTYAYQSGTSKQDIGYQYDLAGNITKIIDKAPTGAEGPGSLDKIFTYDALFRLLSATGRECDAPLSQPSWDLNIRCHDHTTTRSYKREYEYDKMGNILSLQHTDTQHGTNSFTRTYNYGGSKNLLNSVDIGANNYAMSYDANGNLVQENTSRHFEWDHSDQLRAFYNQTGTSEPTVFTHYLYDSGGNRVKKLTRKSAGDEIITVYIDGAFEHLYKYNGTTRSEELNEVHVMDDKSRIATVREGYNDGTPATKFIMEDHLGSSSVVLEDDGSLYNREEFFPFGETSFGAFGKKRYRFVGKEKDEESGLYYYGMRYYAPWQCRFISVDPLAGKYPFYTPYQYAGNKPINFIDLDGLEEGQSPQGGGRILDNGQSEHARGSYNVDTKTYTAAGGGGKKGFDTLFSIAERFGVTVESLQKLNNLEGVDIQAGQTLKIPESSQEAKSVNDQVNLGKMLVFDPKKVQHHPRGIKAGSTDGGAGKLPFGFWTFGSDPEGGEGKAKHSFFISPELLEMLELTATRKPGPKIIKPQLPDREEGAEKALEYLAMSPIEERHGSETPEPYEQFVPTVTDEPQWSQEFQVDKLNVYIVPWITDQGTIRYQLENRDILIMVGFQTEVYRSIEISEETAQQFYRRGQ